MNDLVFLEPNKIDSVPYTTSDVIAEYAEVKSRSVYLLIEKHESDLKEFGRLSFEMIPFETNGGIQIRKVYRLNEQQATLLITYLKNTEPVRQFKKALVKEFYAMRTELIRRQTLRLEMKPIRRELTDVVQEAETSKWAYKNYTDLAYKSTIGVNAAKLRQMRNANKKAIAIDYMTADEIKAVAKAQSQIAVLLEMGFAYEQVKAMLLKRQVIGNVSTAVGM